MLLLYLGGELLVRGATQLSRAAGLSPLVIGLTVVSLGTSTPELAATLTANLKGAPALAFGNVVGSNIANLGLVLGVAALVRPLEAQARFLRRELPFMICVSLVLLPLISNQWITQVEGVILLCLLLVFLLYVLRSDREEADVQAKFSQEYGGRAASVARATLAVILSVLLLVLGARALVYGAVSFARLFGVTERVIGLTVVAFGTSLPELASSLVAAFRRQGDIVLGNLIGSNIFNILFILGSAAAIRPIAVARADTILDILVMTAISLLVWIFLATHRRLSRVEGLLLIAVYGIYVSFLFRY